MNRVQEANIERELNTMKIKLGLSFATNLKQSTKEYLEQQKEEDILKPNQEKFKKIIAEILKKFVKMTNQIIFNQEIWEKLEKSQEITKEDLEWQSRQVKLFEFWLRQQIEGYFLLSKAFYKQQESKFEKQTKERTMNKKQELRNYIRAKSKINIFADYQEALKDKELEKEKSLLEEDFEDEN